MMTRHRVLLATFLVQPDRPTGTARPQVLDLHFQGCVDAGEAVGEGGDRKVCFCFFGPARDGNPRALRRDSRRW
jgi:hypothetical protein